MENRIKALRKKSGFTQDQISKFLDVDQSMIAKIEKGERNLTTVQLNKLANLFACSEEYILGYESKDNPMELAFRIDDPDVDTMQVISSINKVAANINFLNMILGEEDEK